MRVVILNLKSYIAFFEHYTLCTLHFVLFMFILGTVSEHTMLLEGVCSRPAPTGNSAPVTGVEIMRKLSKSHTHNESALRIKVRVGLFCWYRV